MDVSASIGSPLQRRVVDRDEARIPRQMEIRLDESRAQLHGAFERRQSISRRVARSPTMRDYPRFSHKHGYPSREPRPDGSPVFTEVMEVAPQSNSKVLEACGFASS